MIEIKNLEFKYDSTTVLKNIDLEFVANHIYGIVGANGAGKTTLLNCLGNIYYPNNGEILINGKTAVDNLEYLRGLFLLNDNTSYNNNSIVMLIKKIADLKSVDVDYSYLYQLLENLNFDKMVLISSMSKGNRKVAFIIAALALGTKTLILDEFLDGIDLVNRKKIKRELLNYCQNENVTIIISSHTMSDISDICDSVILLQENTVQSMMEIDDLRAKYVTYQIVLEKECSKEFFVELGLNLVKYRSFGNIHWLCINNADEQVAIINSLEFIDLKEVDISLEEVIYNEFKISKI